MFTLFPRIVSRIHALVAVVGLRAPALRFRIQKDPVWNDPSLPPFFLVQLVSSELGKPNFSPKRLRSYNTFFQKTAVLLIKVEKVK